MSDWADSALNQQTASAPTTSGTDWADIALNPKLAPKTTDTRQPSGLTLFMDPSKFGAIASGIASSIPQGPSPNGPYQTNQGLTVGNSDPFYDSQIQMGKDAQANPGYALGGKILGTGLLGAAGGAEGATLPKLAINMAKSAGLAEASQGGASVGQELTPNSPIGPILGGLLAPMGLAGAGSAVKNLGRNAMNAMLPSNQNTKSIIDLATRNNVPLTLGDITGNAGLGKVETALESTPFSGMLKFRSGQQQAIKDAAQNIKDQVTIPPELGDVPGQIQQAVEKTLQQNKLQAGKLYRAANNAAPNDKVAPTNMNMAAQSIVDTFGKNPDLESPPSWIGKVQKYADAKARTYSDLMELRKQVNANQGAAPYGSPEALAWKSIKTGLDSDSQAFSEQPKFQGTDFQQKQQAATQFYKDNVVPFKGTALGKVAQGTSNLDTLVTQWVKPNQPRAVDALMGNMDSQGQNALIHQVLENGFGKANLESDVAPYSAKTFANYWNKLGTTKDALFRQNPDLKNLIDGYVKLIDSLPGPVANPPTGARNTGLLITGALGAAATKGLAAHGPLGAVAYPGAMVATGKGLTSLLTQPWGRRLLTTAVQTNDKGLLNRLALSAGLQLRGIASNPGSVSAAGSQLMAVPTQ